MAQRNVTTDTNYSSLTFIDGDTIFIDNLATLTIDTNTLNIAGITFGSNGGGKVKIQNTSTSTPIFINLSGTITVATDGRLESFGDLIEIGTGNGVTTTFNLPSGSGGTKYTELGACWIDRGDTFRDGVSYKRTYGHVSTLANKLSSHTFGDVFSQDTVANTITFLKPVPSGCKIYIPNIQIKGTHVSNSVITGTGNINLNYTSLSKIVGFSGNGSLGIYLNYCGFGFCQTTNFSNTRRMSGGLTALNTGFNWSYYFDLYGSGSGCILKNVFYISNFHSSGLNPTNQGPGMYLEKVTGFWDREDIGDPAAGITQSYFLNISGPGGKVYDTNIATLGPALTINTSECTYDNNVILPTGNLASVFSRTVTNVTSNGAQNLIRITVNGNASVQNGQIVKIAGVTGVTAANGTWRINSISSTQFDLVGSAFSGTYSGGGTFYSYANGGRTLLYIADNATKNLFTNISIIPSPDALIADPAGLQRGHYLVFSNTGNNNNTFNNCNFSLLACYNAGVPLIVERGTYNRYNNITVKDSATTTYSQRNVQLDAESYGIVVTNWTNENTSNVDAANSSGGTYGWFASRMERILIDEATPNNDFGYAFNSTPKDCPSILAFTNINKKNGRVFALPSLSGSIGSTVFNPANIGPSDLKAGKIYIKNTADSATFETLPYGGITGINMFSARDESILTIMTTGTASSTDLAYQYAVSMRRPTGNYTNPIRVYGSRLTAATAQTGNYSVGDSVWQVIGSGLTGYGLIDYVSGTEIRISNITTSADINNSGYLWGHFLDNVTGSKGTLSGINNSTKNYFPSSNQFTNQYEYLPASSITLLNNAFTGLAPDVDNKVQFKVHVIRDIKDGWNDTFDQRFYGAAIDVDLDPAYLAEFNVKEASITCPNIVAGSRVQIYNVTKGIELDNMVLSTQGYSKKYDLLGNLVNVGDVIRLRATKQTGLTALLPLESLGAVTDAGVSFPQDQEADSIYNSNDINGAGITGITLTPDYTNIQIDLSDNTPPYEITAQQIYNYFCYIITTEQGIRNFYGAIVPIDRMNYQINSAVVSLKIQNTGSTDVIINGGRLFRDDNVSIIDTGAGSGSGSLVHDTGFLLQYIQPQVEAAVVSLAKDSDMQTVKGDITSIKKKTNLIPVII
jgi:hypothetical protein